MASTDSTKVREDPRVVVPKVEESSVSFSRDTEILGSVSSIVLCAESSNKSDTRVQQCGSISLFFPGAIPRDHPPGMRSRWNSPEELSFLTRVSTRTTSHDVSKVKTNCKSVRKKVSISSFVDECGLDYDRRE